MEFVTNLGAARPGRRAAHSAPPAPADGVSTVWALHSEGGTPAAPRYALADASAYLLFGFSAARAQAGAT
jgi:hypothetical protein